MAAERYTHKLTGCAPIPLASYLKALGILRLVSEQVDPSAEGWWAGDVFYLRTTLNPDELKTFFLERYQPTPLIGPWGARSGFFPGASEKSAREALEEIEKSELSRLTHFREAIHSVKDVLKSLKLSEKADSLEDKRALMMECRSRLPDNVVTWLDATYALLETDTKYPPLLGTGGNEGSGSYMSGFAQQIASVIVRREWNHSLNASLFGELSDSISSSQTPGHFSPESAGGANAGSTSEGIVTTNPWDYLLLLEGTLLFASASVKRMEKRMPGVLGFPFCVKQVGLGYGSSADADENHQRPIEMWLPLWSRPSSKAELSYIFSEGRSQLNGRTTRNGVDFARAIAELGTDRGIGQFHRFGFQQRNGLSYFAIPLGKFQVRSQPKARLLADIDGWLDNFRRAASSENASSSAKLTLRKLESSILDLCRYKSDARRIQAVLISLGEAESLLSRSSKWCDEYLRRPVPPLSIAWLADVDDNSPEYRLALSLAGMSVTSNGRFRQYFNTAIVKGSRNRWADWNDDPSAQNQVVWGKASLESNLVSVLQRRSIDAIRTAERVGDNKLAFPCNSARNASLQDIALFLQDDQIDTEKFEGLLRGLLLIDWDKVEKAPTGSRIDTADCDTIPFSDACYAALKLCYSPYAIGERFVSFDPAIAKLASAGRVSDAYRTAARRLVASNLKPAFDVVATTTFSPKRLAASLLFPLSLSDTQKLARSFLNIESQ